MKKLLLTAAFALLGFTTANAQSTGYPKLGVHVGLPVGNAGNFSSFNVGVDGAYLWSMGSNFDLGIATGYTHYLGKEENGLEYNDFGYIPVAATAKFTVAPNFFIGTDLGYGFFVSENAEGGGFYYQPKLGYERGKTEFYLGYKGISDEGASIGSATLGVAFKL